MKGYIINEYGNIILTSNTKSNKKVIETEEN